MNMIEKWKNRETKKKLREENIRLKKEIERRESVKRPSVCTIERNVQELRVDFLPPLNYEDMPAEIIKRRITDRMAEYLDPFIEYGFYDNSNRQRIYTGTLFVATGDRKREMINDCK